MPGHNFVRRYKFIFGRERDVHSKNHLKIRNKTMNDNKYIKYIKNMQCACYLTTCKHNGVVHGLGIFLTLLLMLTVKNSSKL